jgi:hypothetical protein
MGARRTTTEWGDPVKKVMTIAKLLEENAAHRDTAGTSTACRDAAFRPAFLDFATHTIYMSRFADGRLAPIHLLDAIPRQVIEKGTLISGFERGGFFYTRRAVARACEEWRL